jgi:hypothetical protein
VINVQVRAASGAILHNETGAGVDSFFQADATQYPLLGHIVPWSDTVFNRSQVGALLVELDRYEGDLAANPDNNNFDWLRDIFRIASAEPHRMLWFVGD